jgi:hypothetical protein
MAEDEMLHKPPVFPHSRENGACDKRDNIKVTQSFGFPQRLPELELGSGHVGFMVDKAALEQVFS